MYFDGQRDKAACYQRNNETQNNAENKI